MNLFLCLLIAFVFINSSSSQIIEFDESNFNRGVKERELTLVKFHVPWCAWCQKLIPEYQKSSQALHLEKRGSSMRLAEVNCDIENDLCKTYKIKGYPTMLLFKNGILVEKYLGKHLAKSITNYMLKMLADL